MRNKNKKGFTLIELLIVVAIIGLLATIVLVAVTRARKKARASQAKAHIEELMKAVEMAASDNCTALTINSSGQAYCSNDSSLVYIEKLANAPRGCTYIVSTNVSGTGDANVVDANGSYSARNVYTSAYRVRTSTDCFTTSGEYFYCKNGSCSCSNTTGCLTTRY